MEQAAQNKKSGADSSNCIHTIESITKELQLWCVRDMVKSNMAVEIQSVGQWRCGMMEMVEARCDETR